MVRDQLILFSVKRELRKLFFVTSDLKVSRDSWSRAWVLTDIREFTTLFYVIFRRKSSEWLESSIESDLGMRFAMWSLDLGIRDFAFFKHFF